MNRIRAFVALVAVGFILFALAIFTTPPDQVFTGIPHARDGDSLTLEGQNLRLQGLDAPERQQICQDYQGKDYPCGRVAQGALSRLLSRGITTCIGAKRDKYERLLVTCRVNGVNIAAELVKDGHAIAYGAYETEERFAAEDKRGIWAGRFERPENYRQRMRDTP